MPAQRTLDTLKAAFDLNQRRKFDVMDDNGNLVVSLYFKAITRSDRARATQRAGSDDPLVVSTHMLCQLAELEDGTKAFHPSDFGNLQTELPENVLNEIEMFLFGVNPNVTVELNFFACTSTFLNAVIACVALTLSSTLETATTKQ